MNIVTMHEVELVVKCLKCKKTYNENVDAVWFDGITDPDTGAFVHYEVQFLHTGGDPVYLQDLLCLPKHCSIFGRTEHSVFAFPCLAPMARADKWVSSPDRNGDHMATREIGR